MAMAMASGFPKVRLRAQLLRLGGTGDDPRLRHLGAHLHGGNGAAAWFGGVVFVGLVKPLTLWLCQNSY